MTAQIGYDRLAFLGDPRPELLTEVARVQPRPAGDWVNLEKLRFHSTQRLWIGDRADGLVVVTWPAELADQARYLYSGGLGSALVAAAIERGWTVEPWPHIGYWNSSPNRRLYMRPSVAALDYAACWEGEEGSRYFGSNYTAEYVEHELWPWLKQRGFADDGDDTVLRRFLDDLPAKRAAQMRPGLRFSRVWAVAEVAELGSALADTIRSDFDAVFAVAEEPGLSSAEFAGQRTASSGLGAPYRQVPATELSGSRDPFSVDDQARRSVPSDAAKPGVGPPGSDWSDAEVEATVDDYLEMLVAEALGQKYSKAEHRRTLTRKLNPGRTESAIEFKHQNISAVMSKLGLPYIRGYKPRGNYQTQLERVVQRRLQDPQTLAAIGRRAPQPSVRQDAPVRSPLGREPGMSPTLYRDTGYTLNHLVEDIRVGRIGLPDIQRPFVWSATKARDLFDSLYRGYPIGTLMFWESGAEVGTRRIGLDGADRSPQLLVVDGQQRLTALYSVITGHKVLTKSFEERRIQIGFRPSDETFEVADAAIVRDPEFVADITTLWTSGYKTTVRRFLQGLAEARGGDLDDAQQDTLEERIDRLRDLRDFRFQVVELNVAANEEQVAEIFVRINSEGVKLNQSDFILTLMSVHWEKGRKQLEAFSRAAVDPTVTGPSPRNPFLDPSPDHLLRVGVAVAFRRARLQLVYNLLRGKDLETGHVSEDRRSEQFALLAAAQDTVVDLQNWHEFLKCLSLAGFRGRSMISSENAVLFSYALWLIGRRDFGLDFRSLRPVIARWFFMAHATGRYTSSPESALESDLQRLAELPARDGRSFIDELDRQVRANFTNDYWRISLPNRLDTAASRSPALSAYLAALNLLDAEVLFSDVRVKDLLDPAVTAPKSIERHHLFPKAYLASLSITGTRPVNAIANMAFLDWAENSKISDSPPAEYWPVMTDNLEPDRLKRQVRLHALPVGWEQLEYATFLDRRRDLMARVVQEGFATLWGDHRAQTAASVEDLIAAGESETVEFKSTARINLHTGQVDPKIENVIVKTVCGLLNHEGGTLLIGVADDGEILGVEPDLRTLGTKGNVDGYELHLRQLIDSSLSVVTAQTVRIRFHSVAGRQVCVVTVAASAKPVFARAPKGSPDGSEFWVRIGNATKQLHGDDMVDYQQQHWGT